MKILFLSSWFPYPPDNGSRIRAYNLLKALSKNHNIDMISLCQFDSQCGNTDALKDICTILSLHPIKKFAARSLKSYLGLFSSKPRSIIDTFDSGIYQSIKNSINSVKPDLIFVSEPAMMAYLPPNLKIPAILDALEMGLFYRYLKDSRGLKFIARRFTFLKQKNYAAEYLGNVSLYTCVSDDEYKLCSRFFPSAKGIVIPNGVDTEHYNTGNRLPDPNLMVYNGAVTYHANYDAIKYYNESIRPILYNKRPDVKLLVTGRTDGVDLSAITNQGIEFTGYVDDIRDVLNKCSICVVPLKHGGGSRLKILEAMAAGIPVVSTSVGAEGIDCLSGTHLLIADDPDAFAAAIIQLMEDKILAASISVEARKLVEDRYSWLTIGSQLNDAIKNYQMAGG